MSRIVQIAPIGFEYDRIIEGVGYHPCNIIYLLKSYKFIENESDPDKKMIEIAEKFVDNLNDHFLQTKICTPIVKEAILIELEPIIKELCNIIKEEIEIHNADQIWINISTSTKLFVSAAMYVGSFLPEKIRLFYIDASNYTVNDLFNSNMTKEDIKNKFEKKGLTYKEDKESYKPVDVPSYPFEILSEPKKNFLKALKVLSDKNSNKMVKFMNILRELKEDPYDKTVKMRYSHHIKKLKERNLLIEESQGRERRYMLTHEGKILGLILSYF